MAAGGGDYCYTLDKHYGLGVAWEWSGLLGLLAQ